MTKYEIIEKIARERLVEDTIAKYINHFHIKENANNLADLAQMIYLSLLEKDEDYLKNIYNDNKINFYIYRMVSNNISSTTSPYKKMFRAYDLRNDNRICKEKIPYEESELYRDI